MLFIGLTVFYFDPASETDSINFVPKEMNVLTNWFKSGEVTIWRTFGNQPGDMMDCYKRCLHFVSTLLDGKELRDFEWTRMAH